MRVFLHDLLWGPVPKAGRAETRASCSSRSDPPSRVRCRSVRGRTCPLATFPTDLRRSTERSCCPPAMVVSRTRRWPPPPSIGRIVHGRSPPDTARGLLANACPNYRRRNRLRRQGNRQFFNSSIWVGQAVPPALSLPVPLPHVLGIAE